MHNTSQLDHPEYTNLINEHKATAEKMIAAINYIIRAMNHHDETTLTTPTATRREGLDDAR